jgi:hypothetical protein
VKMGSSPFNSRAENFLPGALLTLCLFWMLWFVFSGLILIGAFFAGFVDFFHPHWAEVIAASVGAILAFLTVVALVRRMRRVRNR